MLETIKGIAVIMVCFILLPGIAGYYETHYTREGVVVEVTNDEVVVVDKTENEWVFYGEGYTVGDKVRLQMFTNYTDSNIYDDEIENVKKVVDK